MKPCNNPKCGKLFEPKSDAHLSCSRACQVAALRSDGVRPTAPATMTHVVIPDTQVKPGVPTTHLSWIGQYIADKFVGKPLTVIHLGDHWDMPSLSSYDKGKKGMEGRRYNADVEAGNVGMALLTKPITDALPHHSELNGYPFPRLVLLRGNHEYRIERAVESDAQLEGLLSLNDLRSPMWDVHDFLETVELDGVTYSHYFANPMTGRPYGGQSIDTRLKTVGYSFTMGHQQGLHRGMRSLTNGRRVHGLIAGSCYLHDEDYLGPQGNNVWRGLVVCHQVEHGNYDAMEVSLDYLCRRFEGIPLEEFTRKYVKN